MRLFLEVLFVFVCGAALPLHAIDKNPTAFASPEEEARYGALIEELRCVVCQNQSLADSNAELAQDLRDEVRGMVEEGKSDDEITAFLVQRYGDFVLYRPPLQPKTYLLWLGPGVLLLIASIVLVFIVRRGRRAAPEVASELSSAEQAKLKHVLEDKEEA